MTTSVVGISQPVTTTGDGAIIEARGLVKRYGTVVAWTVWT